MAKQWLQSCCLSASRSQGSPPGPGPFWAELSCHSCACMCAFSGHSSFLPHIKNMHVGLTGNSRCEQMVVRVCPCD